MSTVARGQDLQPESVDASWPARILDPTAPRETLIATAAYYRAARRGFESGHEMEDWLAAEREIDGIGVQPP
ncbi:MAG TPA: DUF2934 domain-containing protein [Steroidobacteraceae bacterium]|jgi:hypothetical protein